MTFYHGSASVLEAGEILYPGEALGLSWHGRSQHVYMTHTAFSLSEVDYVPSGITSAAQFAVYSAVLWACIAADQACEENCDWGMDHGKAMTSAMVPDCVKIYEVEPLGPVTSDDAHDVDPDACRTTEARIIRPLSDRDVAILLDW